MSASECSQGARNDVLGGGDAFHITRRGAATWYVIGGNPSYERQSTFTPTYLPSQVVMRLDGQVNFCNAHQSPWDISLWRKTTIAVA
jgi:hypothetical protein